ncbi:MAG TPA: VWA domain-containing protein [Blastocatellia bacterium]|nr:VWA domain-containing protein [Blastocatellia bacterium]
MIILLLTPFAVLLGFAVYVYIVNAQPQLGDLQTRVSPQVVMPWGEATYFVAFDGHKPTASAPAPLPPVDIVFMVDESGSMIMTIKDMAAAARTVTQELSKEQPGRIRFSAIRFDTSAQVEVDWTETPEKLAEGLDRIAQTAKGGGNDSRQAFDKLDEVLSQARAGANKVIIFYTDGAIASCNGCIPMSEDEIREAARKLRDEQHVDIYSVGLPGGNSDSLMIDVTGDSSHVKDPVDSKDFANIFRAVKVSVMPGLHEGTGVLSHRLNGKYFSAPLGGTSWTLNRSGDLNLLINPVPEAPATYAHPLVPLAAGLWRVGVEPPTLSLADKEGKLHIFTAQHRPALLKVTWLFLLLMFLPALLWSLGHLQPRQRPIQPPERATVFPPLNSPTLPSPLPALPRLAIEPLVPIPTLFIGLGGAGRRAVQAVRADLKQAHCGQSGEPYLFLWVDTDTQETERESPFEDWEGYQIEALVAPPRVRQVESYLPEPARLPDHLLWFDAYFYREASSEQLNLSDGVKGDRSLARLALFQWLAQPDGLRPTLERKVQELASLPSADGLRQVVVFASADGGVGSGWFLDFGRLLQRLGRRLNKGTEVLPDVIGVLCDDPLPPHAKNRQALMMELETTMSAGRFPQRTVYLPDDPVLDQSDSQSPYHWVFTTSGGDKNALAAQCGEFASTLIERAPHVTLLEQARVLSSGTAIAATIHSAHVLPTLIYDQVRCELFLRVLGPDVLLDVVGDAEGGLRLKPVATEMVIQHLDDWARSEASGSPLKALLLAAVHPTATANFIDLVQPPPPAALEWFGNAFAGSVTQRLQGQGEVNDIGWQRLWMPGEAVATLRLLSQRLRGEVQPQLHSRAASAPVREIVDHVAGLAESAADALEGWVEALCQASEKGESERRRLEQTRRRLVQLQRRIYLGTEVRPDLIEKWGRAGLETWLGTADTIAAIRQRLFFVVTANGPQAEVMVRSCIEEPKIFTTAAEFINAIGRLTRALALTVPATRIGGALADTDHPRRRNIAEALVQTQTHPRQVLLVSPQTTGLNRDEQEALEAFTRQIPQPSHHVSRRHQNGDDQSAIRRIELAEVVADKTVSADRQNPFIEMTDSIAETLRRRAEKKYRVMVAAFPPRLRLALANPAAFRSFARAYKAGHIVQREDESGREQWFFTGTTQFLTYGREQSLAYAAANYSRDVVNPQETFMGAATKGAFEKLKQWSTGNLASDEDVCTLVAIDVYE